MIAERLSHHSQAFKKRPEKEVLRAICDYLKICGCFFWRQGNHGVWDVKRLHFRNSQFAKRGLPDIFVIKNNGLGCVLYGIECKNATGKLTEYQEDFKREFTQNGGIYILARSIDDVLKAGF